MWSYNAVRVHDFTSTVGNKIYLHGGIENEKATACAGGLFAFTPGMPQSSHDSVMHCDFVSIETALWEELQVTGSPPTAQSSTTVAHKKSLVSFGGIIGGKAQNCLHSLNLSESFDASNLDIVCFAMLQALWSGVWLWPLVLNHLPGM